MTPPNSAWFYIFLIFRVNLNNEMQRWPTSPKNQNKPIQSLKVLPQASEYFSSDKTASHVTAWLRALLTATRGASTLPHLPKEAKPKQISLPLFFPNSQKKIRELQYWLVTLRTLSPSKHFIKGFIDHFCNHMGLFWQCCVMEDIPEIVFAQFGR